MELSLGFPIYYTHNCWMRSSFFLFCRCSGPREVRALVLQRPAPRHPHALGERLYWRFTQGGNGRCDRSSWEAPAFSRCSFTLPLPPHCWLGRGSPLKCLWPLEERGRGLIGLLFGFFLCYRHSEGPDTGCSRPPARQRAVEPTHYSCSE